MRPLVPIVLLALASSAAAAGDIYCLDKGRDCSDRPSPGAEYTRTAERRPDASPPETPAAPRPAAVTPAAPQTEAASATRRAFQKDLDQARTEQCKKAREAYQQSLAARRIYRTNKDGEREYLSDTEADQLRLNARVEMERSCGSAGP